MLYTKFTSIKKLKVVLDIDKHINEEKWYSRLRLFGGWHADVVRKPSPRGRRQPGPSQKAHGGKQRRVRGLESLKSPPSGAIINPDSCKKLWLNNQIPESAVTNSYSLILLTHVLNGNIFLNVNTMHIRMG